MPGVGLERRPFEIRSQARSIGEAAWKCRGNGQACELEFRRQVHVERTSNWALSVPESVFRFGSQDGSTKGGR